MPAIGREMTNREFEIVWSLKDWRWHGGTTPRIRAKESHWPAKFMFS